MFSAVQQKDPQSSQSHASAIFGDVAALQAAHRRLSGEHPEANDRMNKRAKISKTKRANQLSSQKRAQRVSGRIAKDAFVRNRSDKLKGHDSCCSKECSKAYEGGARANLLTQFGHLSYQHRRDFIHARIGYKENALANHGAHVKEFFLEPATFLVQGLPLTVHPRTAMVRVCTRAMKHLTGTSNNALYQPGVPGHYFSNTVFGGQSMRSDTVADKSEDAIRWLKFIGSFYMHDPTNNFIYVPFASKKVMYQLYVQDHEGFWRDRDEQGGDSGEADILDAADTIDECIFVSQSTLEYASFCSVWRKVCADSIMTVDYCFLITLLLFIFRSVPASNFASG
jgi:hypothetical protein